MANRRWHKLPRRHCRVAICALACSAAMFFILGVSLSESQADERGGPATDGQPLGSTSAAQPALHRASGEELKRWIDQLGSAKFSVREQAVQQLSRCDATAVEPLRKAAEQSTDLEVKSRCLAIADAIYDLDVGKRTSEFLKDPDPTKTYGFEGWLPFSEIVGKNRLSKRLFAELIESHPDYASENSVAPAELAAEAEREALAILNKFRTGQNIELGDAISLLYRSIQSQGKVPASVDQITLLLLRSAPFTIEISRPPMRSVLQKLTATWMQSTQSDPTSVLIIAIDQDIPESIQVARQALGNPQCEPNLFLVAVSALMRFGSQEDLELLAPWRAEKRLLQKEVPVQVNLPKPIPNPDAEQEQPPLESGPRLMIRPPVETRLYELRYQDLALAASAHLSGFADIRRLFPRLQMHPTYVYRPDSLAFPQGDDEARQQISEALANAPQAEPSK